MLLLAMFISGGSLLFPRLPLLLAMVALALVVTGLRLPLRRSMWPLYLVLATVLVITLARPGPVDVHSLAIRLANFFGAVMLLHVYLSAPPGALARDLAPLLRWMALQALATVLLARVLGFAFRPIQVGETTYQTLLGLFNYHEVIEGASGLVRPDGFFFEPGVFQIYLNLYLYLALFVLRKPRQAVLATLAVLATQSTTGVLICMALLVAAWLQRLRQGRARHKLVALLAALVLAPPLALLGSANIIDKVSGDAQGSSWAREYDLFTGLNIIAEHPLLGIGFDHARYLDVAGQLGFEDTLLSAEGLEDRATSNGLVYLSYSLGLPMALAFLWGMFRQTLFPNRWLVGLWLALSLFGEAIVFTPFIMMVVLSAFVSPRRRAAWPLAARLRGVT